jgi:MOSC domain-containing protein YiiM
MPRVKLNAMDHTTTSPAGHLLAVFAGKPQIIGEVNGKPVRSAINKLPVTGPAIVRTLNIDGDEQADLTVHGGADKAVYCYPSEHYPAWEGELGRSLQYGAFGENLTVSGFLEPSLHVGDVLSIGTAVLQVSEPRFPCYKLGIKLDDPNILRPFQKSGRSGFYCRVIEEGAIEAGQAIALVRRALDQPTIAELVARVNKEDGLA